MDIELLFSRQPFVQQSTGQFSWLTPNRTEILDLPQEGNHLFPIPEDYQNANLIVEVNSKGLSQSLSCYAHDLLVRLIESHGQLSIFHRQSQKPLSKVYIKAYCQTKGGEIKFYKDGYTDHRGCFDYVSLTTNALNEVSRFSILVMSDQHGALVREASPPRR